MIKIIGGPHPHNVRVIIVQDDGREIDISGKIQAVSWHCHAADDLAEVTLQIPLVMVDVAGQLGKLLEGEMEK